MPGANKSKAIEVFKKIFNRSPSFFHVEVQLFKRSSTHVLENNYGWLERFNNLAQQEKENAVTLTINNKAVDTYEGIKSWLQQNKNTQEDKTDKVKQNYFQRKVQEAKKLLREITASETRVNGTSEEKKKKLIEFFNEVKSEIDDELQKQYKFKDLEQHKKNSLRYKILEMGCEFLQNFDKKQEQTKHKIGIKKLKEILERKEYIQFLEAGVEKLEQKKQTTATKNNCKEIDRIEEKIRETQNNISYLKKSFKHYVATILGKNDLGIENYVEEIRIKDTVFDNLLSDAVKMIVHLADDGNRSNKECENICHKDGSGATALISLEGELKKSSNIDDTEIESQEALVNFIKEFFSSKESASILKNALVERLRSTHPGEIDNMRKKIKTTSIDFSIKNDTDDLVVKVMQKVKVEFEPLSKAVDDFQLKYSYKYNNETKAFDIDGDFDIECLCKNDKTRLKGIEDFFGSSIWELIQMLFEMIAKFFSTKKKDNNASLGVGFNCIGFLVLFYHFIASITFDLHLKLCDFGFFDNIFMLTSNC